MLRVLGLLFILVSQSVFGIETALLRNVLSRESPPFNYDLNIKIIPGKSPNENVMVCCHGYGGNWQIANTIKATQAVSQHLIGFNFPDHDINERGFNAEKISFGSLNELLPIIYILKQVVVEGQASQVSLYGFSAGGGAVINVIGVLNTSQYDSELQRIGINSSVKGQILAALQKGIVILDSPLKSIEELIDGREKDIENQAIASQYKRNGFRPIDNLSKWKGLDLSVILFFQNPDECLTNRDDRKFIERLKQANSNGKNIIINRDEGGHCGFHATLWKVYRELESVRGVRSQ